MDGAKMTQTDNLFNKLHELGLTEKTEKIAKKLPLDSNIFKRIVGLAGGEGTALGQQIGAIGGRGQDAVASSALAEMKKLLKEQAKKTVRKDMKPSVMGETMDVLSKDPSKVAPGAAVGAGLGAGAGAMVDTDVEETNMLGATKKRPGSMGDRFSNMLAGAALGAGAGGAARARSMASKNISNRVSTKAKDMVPGLSGMSPEDTLNLALEKLTPAQITKSLGGIANKNMKYVGAMDPTDRSNMSNVLNSTLDRLMGAPKQRGMMEDFLSEVRHTVAKKAPIIGGATTGGSRYSAEGIRELIETENPALLKSLGLAPGAAPRDVVNALAAVRSGTTKLKDTDLSSLSDIADTFSALQGHRRPNNVVDVGLKTLGSGVVGAGAGLATAGPVGAAAGGLLGGAGYLRNAMKNAPDKYTELANYLRRLGNDEETISAFVSKLRENKYGPVIQGLV
jgi:hypothetical protein